MYTCACISTLIHLQRPSVCFQSLNRNSLIISDLSATCALIFVAFTILKYHVYLVYRLIHEKEMPLCIQMRVNNVVNGQIACNIMSVQMFASKQLFVCKKFNCLNFSAQQKMTKKFCSENDRKSCF